MNSGDDQSVRKLQEIADGILKKLLLASANQAPIVMMGGKIHFKLTHDGVTRRFALLRADNNLISSLKARVLEIVGAEDVTLYWKDNESSIVLETVDDIDAAIDYAETKNKLGCITLEIGEAVTKKDHVMKEERKVVSSQESRAAFNGFVFTCNDCHCFLSPSNGGRFMCMVCENFDLCTACHVKDIHDNHAFAHLMNGKTEIPFLLSSKGVMYMFAQQAPRCTPKFISSNDYDEDEMKTIDNKRTKVPHISGEKYDQIFEKIVQGTKNGDISDDDFEAALLEAMEKEMNASKGSTGDSVGKEVDRNDKRDDGFLKKRWIEESEDESIATPLIDIGDYSTTSKKRVVSLRIDSPERSVSVATTDGDQSIGDIRRGGRRSSDPSILSDDSTIQPNRREKKIENDDSDFEDDKSLDGYADRVDARYDTEDSTDSDDDFMNRREPLVFDSDGYPVISEKIPEKDEKTAQTWISKPQNNLSFGAEMNRRREENEEKIRRMNDYDSENEKKPWKGRRNDGGFGGGERKTENRLTKRGIGQESNDGGFGGRHDGGFGSGRHRGFGGGFGNEDRGFGRADRNGDRGNGGFGSRRGRGGFTGDSGFRRADVARTGGFGRDNTAFKSKGFGRDDRDYEDRRRNDGCADRGFGSGSGGRGGDSGFNRTATPRNGGLGGFGGDDTGFGDNRFDKEDRRFGRSTEDRRNVKFGGDDIGKSAGDFGREGKEFGDRKLNEDRGFGRSSGRGGKSFGGNGRDDVKGRRDMEFGRRGFGGDDGGFGSSRDDGGFGKRAVERRNNGGFGDRGFVRRFEREENGRESRGFGRSGRFEGRDGGFGQTDSNPKGRPDFDCDRNADEMDAYMRASQMPAYMTIQIIDRIINGSFYEMESTIGRYKLFLENNSHGLKPHPSIFNVNFNENYLISNIAVDLHKHLSALECPISAFDREKDDFRMRLFDTRRKLANALEENGTHVRSYKNMAEKLQLILLSSQYSMSDRPARGLNKEYVGFMVPDHLRDNAKPPRVACSEFYFLFCDEHTNPRDFNVNPSPRYQCPSVFPL